MPTVRLAAGAAVSILLLALCVLLAGPSFDLPGMAPDGGLGAGALPRFVVVAVAVLSVAVFAQQVMAARRARGTDSAATDSAGADFGGGAEEPDPRRVLGLGAAVLVLLAAYVQGWTLAGFLPASIAFILVLGLLLIPAAGRTPRGLLVTAATAVLFSLGVWGLFVHILAVPLR